MDTRRLEDVLREQEVLGAMRELGLDPAAVFGPSPASNPYRHHRWLVKRTPYLVSRASPT